MKGTAPASHTTIQSQPYLLTQKQIHTANDGQHWAPIDPVGWDNYHSHKSKAQYREEASKGKHVNLAISCRVYANPFLVDFRQLVSQLKGWRRDQKYLWALSEEEASWSIVRYGAALSETK
jgi:hypothetical protein